MKEITFEPIPLAAGPRDLPSWSNGAHVDWMHGYGNRPRLKVRCRHNPLEFASFGLPAWEKRNPDLWIAERDGVCRAHYHGGHVAMREFEDQEGWEVKPSKENGWKGIPIKRKYSMLATTHQEGYAGRRFDITTHEGKGVRLIGPWHGGAPDGYIEVSYYIDRPDEMKPNQRWYRKWQHRTAFFGLNIKPELLLDIFATFMPHLEWAWVQEGKWRTLEPLVPETRLPKGVLVSPDDCQHHEYRVTAYDGKKQPQDKCNFCGERRDPGFLHPHEIAKREREKADG